MAILSERMRTPRRNHFRVALLVSLALHALILVWLLERPGALPLTPPTAEAPIAVQVIELPPPSQAGPKARAQAPEAAATGKAGKKKPSAERAPGAVAQRGPEAPEGGGDAPHSTNLMPSGDALEEIAGGGGAGPVVLGDEGEPLPSSERYGWAGPGSGIHAPRIPKDLVGETVAEAQGKHRAELGIVDPYFRDVAKALEGGWHADQRAPPPQTLAEAVRDFGTALQRYKDVWLEGADRYGKTGNPLPPGVGEAFDHGVLADASDHMKQVIGYQTLMSAGFTSVRRAVLRVVQDDTGKIVLVELVEPSRDREMDRQALADVRAAAEKLPPPPASLLGRKSQLSSFWTFEIKLRVIPPTTGIAFEFDEKGVEPLVPFGHQVKKSVRLLYFN
ncbi:MAG TPA: energy transducer TonB [Myxococcaceae bacterium]|nr:energy transducer TonB [Myxococcaceae bacterium]